MDQISEIEEAFNSFDEISFNLSIIQGTSHWISLCLNSDKHVDGLINAYNSLFRLFEFDNCRIVFYEKQFSMDISIVNENTGDILNIKELQFDFDYYPKFLEALTDDDKIDLRIEYGGANILGSNRLLQLSYSPIKRH